MELYEPLSKVFYKDPNNYINEYEKRFNGYGTYKTNLNIIPVIKGKHVNKELELFIVNTPELMKINEKVRENSIKIREMVSEMPQKAITPFLNKLLINELQSTNEIEGVHSTKKEISEALSLIEGNKNIKKRFIGMIKTYKYITKFRDFTKVEDFRKLYDEVVADEVDEKDQPDGELFRKGPVRITDGLNATHVGITPETKIREYLNNLIHFLNTADIPDLYKYMLAHFYYEYVHPFYDGNGRTGRLIVCNYVAKKLDVYTAITLSYSINHDKQKYYKALEDLSLPNNKGEATFFCKAMLEILSEGQSFLMDDLSLGLAKTKKIEAHLKNNEYDKKESAVLETILQIRIFGSSVEEITNKELVEMLGEGFSRSKVDSILNKFESQKIVKQVKNRPTTYQLQDDFIEEILNS